MSKRKATMRNSRTGGKPRRRKRRVLLSLEERQKIEGEFMLTGGHVAQWYDLWSKGREKASIEAREKALKKARAEQLAQLAWGAARAGRPNRAPAVGMPKRRSAAPAKRETPSDELHDDAFAAKLARTKRRLAANRPKVTATLDTSRSNPARTRQDG